MKNLKCVENILSKYGNQDLKHNAPKGKGKKTAKL